MDKSSKKLLILNVATISCLWPDRYDSTKNDNYLKNYALKLYPIPLLAKWPRRRKCELKNHIKQINNLKAG